VDVGGVFVLEVEGVTGFFTEVSGLGSETEVIEYKQTEDRSVIQKIPGRLKWNDITLKRGVTTDLDVSKWRKLVEDGDIEAARKDGSIALMGADGSPVAAWSFEAAWPSKISAGHSKLLSDDVMILEELVLVVEQVRRAAR
jgi:phage tail-like protein